MANNIKAEDFLNSAIDVDIRKIAQQYGVDPNLVESMAKVESNLNPKARSKKGAVGIMQLMPNTAKELGVDPNDRVQNIHGGVRYLKSLLDRFKEPRLAVAAYNAGPESVEKYKGIPPFKETQDYVNKVFATSKPSAKDLLSSSTDKAEDFLKSAIAVKKKSSIMEHPIDWLGERLQSASQNLARQNELIAKGDVNAAMERALSFAPLSIGVKGGGAAGKLSKEILGMSTGAGKGAVEEALKGSKAFKEAMRGKMSGQEIVENAKSALESIKIQRAANYQQKLAEVTAQQGAIDISPIRQYLGNLMSRYNVQILPNGKIDYSRIAMGKSGRKDIKEIIDTVAQWGGKQGDDTAVGLDILKRQLDDFYSDSSQARAFVASLRNKVHATITDAVPQYGEMTKAYKEATNLIKDIGSNLMLRKEGMSGRIVADQTLRRLTSAMRENFEMRNELLQVLGKKGGQDLAGQVAGYSMKEWLPRGLIGKLTGSTIFYFSMLQPKFWPVLMTSSPRVVAEFLNVYGKALKATGKLPPQFKPTVAKGIAVQLGADRSGTK